MTRVKATHYRNMCIKNRTFNFLKVKMLCFTMQNYSF